MAARGGVVLHGSTFENGHRAAEIQFAPVRPSEAGRRRLPAPSNDVAD
jgi:hypothetical protein